MEKIYMEENSNRSKKSKKIDVSVILSFVVAIVAVFSLVACGISQISYAAPVTDDEFTLYTATYNIVGYDDYDTKTKNFPVPTYFSDSALTNPVFCVEHTASVVNGTKYSQGDTITDYGLLYLLNNSFLNNNYVTSTSNKYVETWITQVAIWMYLYEQEGSSITSSSPNYLTADQIAAIKATTFIYVPADTSYNYDAGESIYTKYVAPLVKAAQAANDVKMLTVTKESDTISEVSGSDVYQTAAITVVGNPSKDLTGYDISLNGIDGAYAVDENGEKLATENVSAGTKFYVRIPKSKVTETVQTLTISVTGHFKSLTGSYYTTTATDTAGDVLQKVVTVTGTTKDVSSGVTIEVVGAPDTGMTTAQTIYFIGLIVLLCGVGIIYANAKPVESKQ
jgi:hypothetical protein